MIQGLAAAHYRTFQQLIQEGGVTITVYQPVAPSASASAMDKVLGKVADAKATALGTSASVKGLWSGAYARNDAFRLTTLPPAIAAVGQAEGLDIIFRCDLADVLSDVTDKQSRTLFESAKIVVFQGQQYEVKATDRSGLPPLGPYIFWVGLRKA